MKKTILPILAVAAIMASCGPNADETAKKEQHMKDSIDFVEKETKRQLEDRLTAVQDSLSAATKASNEQMEKQVDAAKDNLEKTDKANKKEIEREKKDLDKVKKDNDKMKNEKANEVKPGQGRG